MFFFLPVIKNLLQGKGIDTSGGWFIGFHAGLKDIFKGCFFLTVPYTGQGLTLFCGSVSLIALIGFFIGRKQNLKAKLWTLGYLLFVIFYFMRHLCPTGKYLEWLPHCFFLLLSFIIRNKLFYPLYCGCISFIFCPEEVLFK